MSLIRPSTGSILLPLPTIDQGDSAGTTPERAEARPTNGSEACEFGAGFGEAGVGEGFAPGHRGVDGPQIHRYCDFMRNLTISVDDAVYRRAHKKAAAEETSLSRVVQHFLEQWAGKDDPQTSWSGCSGCSRRPTRGTATSMAVPARSPARSFMPNASIAFVDSNVYYGTDPRR